MKVGVMEGSLRKESLSRAFARNVGVLAPPEVNIVEMPSTEELPHFNQDVMDAGIPKSVEAFGAAYGDIDALLIVTPEYNWSVPGTLKNAIDWLSRLKPLPLENKPVAIWTASPGLLGGARVHESLRQILHSQGMIVMAKPEVQIAGAKGKIDTETNKILNKDTATFLKAHLKTFAEFSSRCSD